MICLPFLSASIKTSNDNLFRLIYLVHGIRALRHTFDFSLTLISWWCVWTYIDGSFELGWRLKANLVNSQSLLVFSFDFFMWIFYPAICITDSFDVKFMTDDWIFIISAITWITLFWTSSTSQDGFSRWQSSVVILSCFLLKLMSSQLISFYPSWQLMRNLCTFCRILFSTQYIKYLLLA